MILSLEGWSTKAKEAPSPHEVRMSPLDTNLVFQSLGGKFITKVYNKSFYMKRCFNQKIIHSFQYF